MALCEGGLRLIGYGYSAGFVREQVLADGTVIFRENRWCTAPFFSPELVRRPQPMRLSVVKDPSAFRIFVLGSSAAMGDPEASFSVARVLEKLLQAAYPDVRFEVVNAGITAVNSHVVRGIAADCATLQPDVFLIYEGNNEVIGPFGPGGVFTPFLRTEGAVRAAVALRASRTGQLISRAGRAFGARSGPGGLPEDWGGMEMFLKQRIAADDPRLDAVRAHFHANLMAMVRSAQQAGAAAVVCTVATNARTFAPFASVHAGDLSVKARERWDAHWADAERAERAGDLAAAESAYRAALAVDSSYAELHYRMGQLALRTGRDAEGREHLQRALDLDALRFRTDSSLNDVIRSLASTVGPRGDGDGVAVVDAAELLASASPYGVCGDEFFYEHVHLSLRGTYELARVVLPAIQEQLARRGWPAESAVQPILSYDEIRARLGFTAYEQGMIAQEMLSRLNRPPFTAQTDHAVRLDVWRRRSAAAQELLGRPESKLGLRAIMESAMRAAPDDTVLARNTGMMLVAQGSPADAIPFLERFLAWIDDDADTLAALALAQRASGHPSEAEGLLEKVRALEPRHPAVNGSAATH